ncbi:phenylalanine--tRNA ligase subunit beta [Telmatospirillum sp. J64-1]|uniref:phenylalanine--tRNA ligase subunit beta n=1 Tax=Telmatospirillum sp. J64-1 TaxID=2502183 RepID=UPI00115E1C6A|nr:phenylalanine--tRNA ligase subunit beta [Telmatospirillum sp. J64-1]
MKFTLSWLKQHLDTEASLDQIVEKLTALGLEVEDVKDPSAQLQPFTVARIQEAEKHPNADRLRVCKVDTGSGVIQVVCGAPNARAGLKVILAQPGARIPVTGDVLKKGVVRGVESQGMMCSWRELGLGEDHEGIAELEASSQVGAKLVDVMEFDPVIDISLTPNRADCLGIRGIARDLAAAGLGRLKPLTVEPVPASFTGPIGVRLDFTPETASACSLFAGRCIRGVKNGESPQWLKDRLTAIGLRPISVLVDITNFFTFDLARPLHVFDADKLKGDLHVRLSKAGETLEALNDKSYVLDDGMTVIADEAGVQSLAGVIGGAPTGVTEDTVTVFLESALFDPVRTAMTGRKLSIDSDARHRFERHVDPESVIPGMELATRMIIDLCGGEASEPVIAGSLPEWRHPATLRPSRVAELGGVEMSKEAMIRILKDLGCEVNEQDGTLLVVPPSWRADITAEHDLVEEVVRVYGYDNIPVVLLPRPSMPRTILTAPQKRDNWVRRSLAGRGMVETVTWSFTSQAFAELFGGGQPELALANPISADLDAMRPSILPNLIAAAGRNAARGMKDLALFEIGPQFFGDEPGKQHRVATGLRAGATGPRHWGQPPRAVDVFDAKADVLAAIAAAGGPAENLQVSTDAPGWYHPGRSGCLKLGNKVVASFGEIHPRVLKAVDVDGPMVGFELFLDVIPQPKAKATKAKPLLKASPFQALERDFAFVVDADVAAEAMLRAAKGADKALITEVSVFDVYQGDKMEAGKKSVAISVTLQPQDRTLTDEEIEAVSKKVVDAVVKVSGGVLRG